MDQSNLALPSTPRFLPKSHARTPSRSPTRPRLMDDVLSDLSPATTLEAFTSVSGALKASIEEASSAQRAFGIRAAIASKNIQEWVTELSAWPWPKNSSEGFDVPALQGRKVQHNKLTDDGMEEEQEPEYDDKLVGNEEYWGSLPAHDVQRYEMRIEEISEDMEDLNVEEIKSQVLNTHALPSSPNPSLPGPYMEASYSQAYKRIDDFTAVVTATVLQALPSLSRLITLMDLWSVRLSILRQVAPLMKSMGDAEVALKSGWNTIQIQQYNTVSNANSLTTSVLSRQDYEIMRDVLQDKVSKLGKKLDYMLDAVEGRDDTLPETWLDRMEAIEQNYGEWVVCGEKKVRDGEWQNEVSKLREYALSSASTAFESPPAVSSEGDFVHEYRGSTDLSDIHGNSPMRESASRVDTVLSQHDSVSDPPYSGILVSKPVEDDSDLSLFDGHKDGNSIESNLESAPAVNMDIPQAKKSVDLTNYPLVAENLELPSIKSENPPSPLQSQNKEAFSGEIAPPELYPYSDCVSNEVESDAEGNRSIHLEDPIVTPPSHFVAANGNGTPSIDSEILKPMTPEAARQILISDDKPNIDEMPSTPVGISPSAHCDSSPVTSVSESFIDKKHYETPSIPPTTKIPPFGHPLANSLRRKILPEALSSDDNSLHHTPGDSSAFTLTVLPECTQTLLPQNARIQGINKAEAQHQSPGPAISPLPMAYDPIPDQIKSIPSSAYHSKATLVDLPSSFVNNGSDVKSANHLTPGTNPPTSSKGHARGPSSTSMISGYATSEPSPELYEAEPTEYFRPVSPPIIATSIRTSYDNTPLSSNTPETRVIPEPKELYPQRFSPSGEQSIGFVGKVEAGSDSDKTQLRQRPVSGDSVTSVVGTASAQGRTSQDGSVTSEVSTINERLNSITSTPKRIESPEVEIIPRSWHSQFVSDYDGDSPSLGRVRLHNDASNYSPGDSPLPVTPSSERHPLHLHRTPSFDPDSFDSESPATPGDPPTLSNVELSPTPGLPGPSKHTDDQLQQQISEILESIPARIRLTSEPDIPGMSEIKQPKKRISLNPFSRPASRAATPSFTLAPAYTKNPRPRPQNGTPEIKLYHLSRSTGEAPIKLFVRLVGERGERVMVRVGGGWADLGEYLKEYASHHGRRSDQAGRVEIQDLPPRAVSTSSTTSNSTLRNGTWNTSEASSPLSRPGSRPSSALGRPLSSLAMRKTRKSVGEEAREKAYRSPSTPLSPAFRHSPSTILPSETPPSANSTRSVSQMSWREEESSLGLAGPRSRKGEISAENAAWVESMKEKVRIASAEKKDKASFGEMGQVGATKRLFKKSG